MSVVVTTGAGSPGPTGATGATGNGAVDQSVDSLQANPRSVTDWTPIITTAIAAGTRRFKFGPYDYPFATELTLNPGGGVPAGNSIQFVGTGGIIWPTASGGRTPTRLIWQGGAGSGPFINGLATTGFVLNDLSVCYLVASGYDGDLITFKNTLAGNVASLVKFSKCYFGGEDLTSTVRTARCLLNLTTTVNAKFEGCSFGDALALVRGLDDLTLQNQTTDIEFQDCLFENWDTSKASVMNVTTPWKFVDCTWEVGYSWQRYLFDSDIGTSGSPLFTDLTLQNCWAWDGTLSSQGVYNQRVGNYLTKLEARDCFYDIPVSPVLFNLQGPGDYIDIDGGNWAFGGGGTGPFIDLGPASTAYKQRVKIEAFIPSNGQFVTNTAGHGHVEIRLPVGSGGSAQTSQVRAVDGYERHSYPRGIPSVAVHLGAVGLDFAGIQTGSDDSGLLLINLTSTSASGLIADVTFTHPLVPHGKAPFSIPIVLLTPVTLSGSITGLGITSSVTTAVAPSNAYAALTYSATTDGITGFSVGLNGAAGVTGHVAWAYKVIVG